MNAQVRVLAARTLVAEFRTAQGARRETVAGMIDGILAVHGEELVEFLGAGGGLVVIEFERLVRYSGPALTHVSPTAH